MQKKNNNLRAKMRFENDCMQIKIFISWHTTVNKKRGFSFEPVTSGIIPPNAIYNIMPLF